jgi:hypothetical protein
MSHISVDVDIDDIISELSSSDRARLFKALQEDGCISNQNDDFNIALGKLWNNGWKLTKEEEDYIINISKRFV